MTLNYYQDPGHGWVKVKLQTLLDLGIHDKITRYSYVRNDHAYLEEDCDLGLLFKTCDAKGIKIVLRDHHTNKQSKIRSYQSYHVTEPLTEDAKHVISFIKEHFQFINVGEINHEMECGK
jgi:hypothetical protein